MYYVYTLKSKIADQVYTGFTTNLDKRLKEHNSGKSVHTNKFRPWDMVTAIRFGDKQKARDFEKYLKTGSGIAFSRKHFL
jgi:putative endonuclease